MSLRLALVCSVCMAVSACATVDLNTVGSTNASEKSATVDVNVVQKAVAKLQAVFSNKGFVEKDSRKRMQTAAKILLKGLEANETAAMDRSENYAEKLTDTKALNSDITLATYHVEQTTKAAEIYLAMASDDASLRDELVSLEKALLASREAGQIFEKVCEKAEFADESGDLLKFNQSVDALRNVTNAFGERVRNEQPLKTTMLY